MPDAVKRPVRVEYGNETPWGLLDRDGDLILRFGGGMRAEDAEAIAAAINAAELKPRGDTWTLREVGSGFAWDPPLPEDLIRPLAEALISASRPGADYGAVYSTVVRTGLLYARRADGDDEPTDSDLPAPDAWWSECVRRGYVCQSSAEYQAWLDMRERIVAAGAAVAERDAGARP
jgi:hypothetical protein